MGFNKVEFVSFENGGHWFEITLTEYDVAVNFLTTLEEMTKKAAQKSDFETVKRYSDLVCEFQKELQKYKEHIEGKIMEESEDVE